MKIAFQKPLQELRQLTWQVAGQTTKQHLMHTKEYFSNSMKHLKMLPKIRSFEDATHFATEAGNRSIAYAKKTLAVLQDGMTQYQGWAKKTAKAFGLFKTNIKPSFKTTKKNIKQPQRKTTIRREEKQEKQQPIV